MFRILGLSLLLASTSLPLATCSRELSTGETATVTIGAPGLESLGERGKWLTVAAYSWPLLTLSVYFLTSRRLPRRVLRASEAALLLYSLVAICTSAFWFGTPAVGFYVGVAGVIAYAFGVVAGVPPALRVRTAQRER